MQETRTQTSFHCFVTLPECPIWSKPNTDQRLNCPAADPSSYFSSITSPHSHQFSRLYLERRHYGWYWQCKSPTAALSASCPLCSLRCDEDPSSRLTVNWAPVAAVWDSRRCQPVTISHQPRWDEGIEHGDRRQTCKTEGKSACSQQWRSSSFFFFCLHFYPSTLRVDRLHNSQKRRCLLRRAWNTHAMQVVWVNESLPEAINYKHIDLLCSDNIFCIAS